MVTRVPVESPTRAFSGRTNAYVIGSEVAGSESAGCEGAILLDPPAVSGELDAAIDRQDVTHVAVTHHHPDHVGGLAHYARTLDLTVWARYGRTTSFVSATGVEPDRTFVPGELIPAGGGLEVVDTPGHAPEHVAFRLAGRPNASTNAQSQVQPGFRSTSKLVTGDLLVEPGSVVVGAPTGDMRAYITSLRRIHAMNPEAVYPGHGDVIGRPRATCERLLVHRRRRETLIREAVYSGAKGPDSVVDAVYEKDVSDVYGLARATVVAHLEKLAVEGAIRWDGTRAEPTGQ